MERPSSRATSSSWPTDQDDSARGDQAFFLGLSHGNIDPTTTPAANSNSSHSHAGASMLQKKKFTVPESVFWNKKISARTATTPPAISRGGTFSPSVFLVPSPCSSSGSSLDRFR